MNHKRVFPHSFNSLLEMLFEIETREALWLDRVFQFSIGDAKGKFNGIPVEVLTRFQFSIGDARQRLRM